MFDLRHIDLVIGLVGTDPLDPDDSLLEIDGNHEAIVIALDVENDPLGTDDARCRFTATLLAHIALLTSANHGHGQFRRLRTLISPGICPI